MKPKFLAFPRHLVLTSSAAMAVLAPLGTFAADFTWKGATDSVWTDGTNWLLGAAPVYGTDYSADRLVIGNGGNAGAVYNPPSGETTLFGSGRGIIIGSTTQGPANLTVTSGTLKINGPATAGNEPIMANGVNATLLINGGHLDLSGHGNGFRLCNTGVADLTSEMTITSGTFSSGTFDFFTGGSAGTSTVNLDGGELAVTRFLKTQGSTTSTLNLDGGTLRPRNTQTSPNVFLADLTGLTTTVEDGGVIVDTNGFDATIVEVLEHDISLGVTPDGGLTKNDVGTLVLSGDNTFTGPVTVNAGSALTTFSRLTLNHDNAAGTGTITLADSYAEIRLLGTTGRSIANPLVISNTGDEKSLLFTQAGTATCSGDITINETNPDHFRVRTDSSNLTLSGKISGAGGINKYAGGGTLTLNNGSNDFTGGVRITTGTLDFAAGALGSTGDVIMDGSILRWMAGNTDDVSSRIVMVDGKNASFSTNGNDVTFATAIGNSSTGSFVKTTTGGTLTLNGTNTYTGTTTVGGGTLLVNGSLDAASAVTVTGGNLGGTGTIGGSVTAAAGGSIAPGASAGTLTIGATLDVAAMAGGAGKLKFDLGSNTASSDQIAVTGTLTLGVGALGFGDFEFTNLGTLAAGTYTLITSGGINPGDSLDGADLSGAIDGSFNGALSLSGGNIVLEVTGAASGFAAWQTANSTAGGLDDDHDGDGVSNGIEFFTYGPVANSGFTALPGVTNTAGVLSVTWTKATGYSGTYGSGFVVETSPDLQNPWTTETLGGTVAISGPNNEFVTYTFPAGTKNFARLKVTGP